MRLIAVVGSHGWIRPCPLARIPSVLVSESFVFYDWPSHNLLWTFALQEKAKSFTVVLNVTCYWIWQRYDSAACSSSSKTLHLWSVSSVQSYYRDRYVRLCFAISVFFYVRCSYFWDRYVFYVQHDFQQHGHIYDTMYNTCLKKQLRST